MRFVIALLLCGCSGSLQLGVGGSSSNPPPPPPAYAATAPAEPTPAVEEVEAPPPAAAAAPAPTPTPTPVDPALRKRARRVAAQVETMMAKMTVAFSSANGQCKRVAANLRGVSAKTKKLRADIQRALDDAEKDDAFAAEWKTALDEISERTEAKIGALSANARACQDDPDVFVAIQPLRLRIFKKERPATPE